MVGRGGVSKAKLELRRARTLVRRVELDILLEVREAIDILRGEGPADTTEVTYALGAEMLCLGGVAKDSEEGRAKMDEAVRSGKIKRGDNLLLEAFGGDFTWGSALVRY